MIGPIKGEEMKLAIAALVALSLSPLAFASTDHTPPYCNPNMSLTEPCTPTPGPYYDGNHNPYWPITDGENYGHEYKLCSAADAQGRVFNFYQTKEFSNSYLQRQALAACHAKSHRPETCVAEGCRWRN